jgi:hypothetical protein
MDKSEGQKEYGVDIRKRMIGKVTLLEIVFCPGLH